MQELLAFLAGSKYILLGLGSFLEGSVVMMLGGFFLRLGQVELVPLFLALLAGDILSDIVLYLVGYVGGRPVVLRWGHRFGITPPRLDAMEALYHQHHSSILFISKLTMGFGLAYVTLLSAGLARVPFLRYLSINILGAFIWIPFLVFVGYFFGDVFELVPRSLKIAFGIVLFIAVFFGLRALSRFLTRLEIGPRA